MTGGFLALLGEVAFRLLEPWPLKVVVDAIVKPNARSQPGVLRVLLLAAIAIIVVAAFRALSSYLMTVALSLAGSRAMTRVRRDVYDHMLSLSVRYHGKAKTGDLVNRLTGDISRLTDVAVSAVVPLAGNVVTLIGMTVVMIWLDPMLALIVVAAFPVFLMTSARDGRRITSAARVQRRREGDLAGTVSESLGAITVVHAYGLEQELGNRFASNNNRSLREGAKTTRLSAGLERRTDLLIGAATAAVVFAGGSQVLSGHLTPGELIVFVTYLKGAFKPMRDMAKYTGRIAKAAASGERIVDVLTTDVDIRDLPHARPAPRFAGHVQFDDVTAAYGAGRVALKGVTLDVPAGSTVGVVGESGAGKSTLASLLLRLQDPVSGRVLVDGHDMRDLTLASLRSQVAIVLQESVLFATDVRENIRFGSATASDEEVEHAARLARADEFIRALPDGYDSELGERGATLSGGQRQRIAIARAMLRDAPIVVLDEATAGLDGDSEREVRAALERLCADRTTFVISHDPEAVRHCDVVVRLQQGRLRAISTRTGHADVG
ncbi:MAG: ATP-binding cassette, subfamily bacterial [Actinomycetota bacterium]|nr:ATP-binding cassette, subfamily bacterial [Actinomycetota bacterium]